MRNARFWEYVNGSDVKITLRPGESKHWHRGGRTEEGWESQTIIWEDSEDDGCVYCTIIEEGKDCDGGYRHTNVFVCPIADLRPEPWAKPKWLRFKPERVWDEYAQAAGY